MIVIRTATNERYEASQLPTLISKLDAAGVRDDEPLEIVTSPTSLGTMKEAMGRMIRVKTNVSLMEQE